MIPHATETHGMLIVENAWNNILLSPLETPGTGSESPQYRRMLGGTMIPAGYTAKFLAEDLDWLKAPSVEAIYSVSRCILEEFTDGTDCWKHNDFWLYDSVNVIREVAEERSVELAGARLFYYELFESQYDEEEKRWEQFQTEQSFGTNVIAPVCMALEGYDVVTFSSGTSPECSPLSCNHLAEEIETNEYCLLPSLEEAKTHLEKGSFDKSEPGPFRIFAVYSLE